MLQLTGWKVTLAFYDTMPEVPFFFFFFSFLLFSIGESSSKSPNQFQGMIYGSHILMRGMPKNLLAMFSYYYVISGCSPVSSEGSRRHKQMTPGLYNFTLLFSVPNFWCYILSPSISLQARQLPPTTVFILGLRVGISIHIPVTIA